MKVVPTHEMTTQKWAGNYYDLNHTCVINYSFLGLVNHAQQRKTSGNN